MPQKIIGVDVAKNWIDVCWPNLSKTARIDTTPRALNSFARKAKGALVVLEASGGYERPLIDALEVGGANPAHARSACFICSPDLSIRIPILSI